MVYNTDAIAVQSTAVTAFISVLASIDVVGNTIVCLLIIKFQDMRLVVSSVCYKDTSVLLENIPLVKLIKTTSRTRVVYFP